MTHDHAFKIDPELAEYILAYSKRVAEWSHAQRHAYYQAFGEPCPDCAVLEIITNLI